MARKWTGQVNLVEIDRLLTLVASEEMVLLLDFQAEYLINFLFDLLSLGLLDLHIAIMRRQ